VPVAGLMGADTQVADWGDVALEAFYLASRALIPLLPTDSGGRVDPGSHKSSHSPASREDELGRRRPPSEEGLHSPTASRDMSVPRA